MHPARHMPARPYPAGVPACRRRAARRDRCAREPVTSLTPDVPAGTVTPPRLHVAAPVHASADTRPNTRAARHVPPTCCGPGRSAGHTRGDAGHAGNGARRHPEACGLKLRWRARACPKVRGRCAILDFAAYCTPGSADDATSLGILTICVRFRPSSSSPHLRRSHSPVGPRASRRRPHASRSTSRTTRRCRSPRRKTVPTRWRCWRV